MCRPKLLHENNFGHVMTCSNCGDIQLCLGNIITTVCYQGFKNLKKAIESSSPDFAKHQNSRCSRARITVRTAADNLWVVFDHHEFIQVQELFNVSCLMLDAEAILMNEN